MIIQSGFFQHIYHIGCAFNFHSIINNGLIPGGQNSSKRQTVFFLPIDLRDKGHQDPAKIDFNKPKSHKNPIEIGLNVPRRAQYLRSAWKKHHDAENCGSTSILLLRQDCSSIRLDRMQSFFKKHFQLVVFRKLLE